MLATAFFSLWSMLYVAMIAWLGHRYIDVIEGSMPGSKIIQDNKKIFSGAGLAGVVYRVMMAANVLTFPRIYLRRGLADLTEINDFPGWLRKRLLFNVNAFFVTSAISFGLCGLFFYLYPQN